MSANDPGAGVFGGDPFWVSMLGSAYVGGLHEGSQNRLLVIPKHFPGRGSSDRLGEKEVATVRKSFEELQQIELAPFFAVTRESRGRQRTCGWPAGFAYSLPGLPGQHSRHDQTGQFRCPGPVSHPWTAGFRHLARRWRAHHQ